MHPIGDWLDTLQFTYLRTGLVATVGKALAPENFTVMRERNALSSLKRRGVGDPLAEQLQLC